MNKEYPHGIGPGGCFMIFAGVPALVVAGLTCAQQNLERIAGQKGALFGTLTLVLVLFGVSMYVFDRIPKRLVVPIGIVGWISTFSLLYWFFCFGPGSFGHSTL